MSDDLRISDETAARILDFHLLATGALQKSRENQQPLLLLVAGQPGAGKTGTAEAAKAWLRALGGYIHLDADRLRESLRQYPQLAKAHGEKTSVITQAAAGKCVAQLRTIAVAQKRNILEEGTLRAGADTFTAYAQKMQAHNYRVELRIMAVAPEESRLGIYQRYEGQIAAKNPAARFVPDPYHDQACEGMIDTVAALAAVANRVCVVNRQGQMLHDGDAHDAGRPQAAVDAIRAGRILSSAQKAELAQGWDILARQAESRKAAATYLEQIARHQAQAHALMRKDPDACNLYDAKLPRSAAASRALAAAHESLCRDSPT